jgi:hypothetical protein
MLILAIILFGMIAGGLAQMVLGQSMRDVNWTLAILTGLIGSFVGGRAPPQRPDRLLRRGPAAHPGLGLVRQAPQHRLTAPDARRAPDVVSGRAEVRDRRPCGGAPARRQEGPPAAG